MNRPVTCLLLAAIAGILVGLTPHAKADTPRVKAAATVSALPEALHTVQVRAGEAQTSPVEKPATARPGQPTAAGVAGPIFDAGGDPGAFCVTKTVEGMICWSQVVARR